MKKILLVLLMVGVLVAPACEGPEGPQGPPGFDGQDGVDGEDGADGLDIIDLVFEAEVDFTEENGYAAAFNFGEWVFEDDNFLVFREFGVTEDGRSIWRLLPQTVFLGEAGILIYNYEFAHRVLAVFLDGAFDATMLGPQYTDDQYFRIVYMPGLYPNAGEGARVDYSDFDAVMKMLGKTEKDIVKLDSQ
ncbi:MAG TPA: hypothetical protein VK957_03620 [Lunatimonas sp.]|nr:hypothetical protein [Lunatimonas sp.]